jgi:hypothetical protein
MTSAQPTQNYYEILELPRNATTRAIESSYQRLALLRRDKNSNDPDTKAAFELVCITLCPWQLSHGAQLLILSLF